MKYKATAPGYPDLIIEHEGSLDLTQPLREISKRWKIGWRSPLPQGFQMVNVEMPPDPPRCPWCNDEPLEVTTGGVVVTRPVCPKCGERP